MRHEPVGLPACCFSRFVHPPVAQHPEALPSPSIPPRVHDWSDMPSVLLARAPRSLYAQCPHLRQRAPERIPASSESIIGQRLSIVASHLRATEPVFAMTLFVSLRRSRWMFPPVRQISLPPLRFLTRHYCYPSVRRARYVSAPHRGRRADCSRRAREMRGVMRVYVSLPRAFAHWDVQHRMHGGLRKFLEWRERGQVQERRLVLGAPRTA